MTDYEIQECLVFLLRIIKDGNHYDLNSYEPTISIEEARSFMARMPQIRQHLLDKPVKKPLQIRTRKLN